MIPTINFLAPSLHPNTLVDLTFPDPGPSSYREPIVRHLAIKHGEHQPLGLAKRMILRPDGSLVVADDKFQISTLSLGSSDEPIPPEVVSQHTIKGKKADTWSGLIDTAAGAISSLSSGTLTLTPSSSQVPEPQTVSIPAPVLCMSSSISSSTTFAVAGKELDLSIRDIERTFSSSAQVDDTIMGKRKSSTLEFGETWRAKNLPMNNLSLRVPIHHLSLTHLHDHGENSLVTGTKAGTVRRYDTRQRKPVSDWKVAREGGVGSVVSGVEHELFFSDRSSFLGAIDLRTGRLMYSYPNMTATAHHLLSIPPSPDEGMRIGTDVTTGLASISSDATLRIHSTIPPSLGAMKGNVGGEKRKAGIVGMAGGVGVGGFVFRGWGSMAEEVEVRGVKGGGVSGGESEEEEGDEGVWEGMSEVEDEEVDEDDEEEEEEVAPKKRRQ